jgi:hypothetical protein
MNENSGVRGNRSVVVVWTIAALGLAVIAVLVWSSARAGFSGETLVSILTDLSFAIALVAFVISGAVIVSRQPKNIIGRLLMIPGLVLPAAELIHNWLVDLDPVPVNADLTLWLATWFDGWSWVLLIFPIFHLLLVFPTGRLISPRWRWVVGVEGAMVAFMLFSGVFADRIELVTDAASQEVVVWSVANPIGFLPEGFFSNVFGLIWSLGLVGLTVAGVVAVVRRFRAGSRLERQQLKWPLYAVGVFGFVYAWTALGSGVVTNSGPDVLLGLAIAVIPVSVAVAVLRYRLYDLDRIVSRTVTYLVVAVLTIGAYVLVVLMLGSFLGRDNPVAVAGATLAAAALFNPVRTRIRRWVDRRFNRPRYDTERVMDQFTDTLRHRVDPEEVVVGWVGVVSETMHPATVGLWLKQ